MEDIQNLRDCKGPMIKESKKVVEQWELLMRKEENEDQNAKCREEGMEVHEKGKVVFASCPTDHQQ